MSDFQAIKISERVYWVGAIDWALKDFHGYATNRGSTYNAYLIMGDEPILVDTVKAPFFSEMLERIKSVIDPVKIKYLISNHAEMDHSGSIPELMKVVKFKKIFASQTGVGTLKDHFHFQDEVTPVKTGDKITLGNATLAFIETKMLHWPESMFTYFQEEGILFSQDAFGMHYANHELFSDLCDQNILREEAARYYANILMPYSALVTNLFNNIPKFKLDLQMIAPVHGPIWRQPVAIEMITKLWQEWAQLKSYPKVVIVYDTMWQSTAKMAAAIADGVAAHHVQVKVLPLSKTNRSEIALELLEAGALLIGSPTLNQQIFPTVADTLCYLSGLKRKNLIGQAFGSYGWAGEAIKILQDNMTNMGVELIGEAVKVRYVPTTSDYKACFDLGEKIVLKLCRGG